jgi:hypothetical protein
VAAWPRWLQAATLDGSKQPPLGQDGSRQPPRSLPGPHPARTAGRSSPRIAHDRRATAHDSERSPRTAAHARAPHGLSRVL